MAGGNLTAQGLGLNSATLLFGSTLIGTLLALSSLTHASAALLPPAEPTAIRLINQTPNSVYANLVLGQAPKSLPANCSKLGRQIVNLKEVNGHLTSSIPHHTVAFTAQSAGVSDKGYYQLRPGEIVTYRPAGFPCSKGTCSPAMAYNFFFTSKKYLGNPNTGCGGTKEFGDAANLAEGSINFSINDAQGNGCANADAADISAVNGINAFLKLELKGQSWPFPNAENSGFGHNANEIGVYGWAATTCTANVSYPNPQSACAPPLTAPRAKNGMCKTPGGTPYAPIVDARTNIKYCDERSDPTQSSPHGQCLSQRAGNVTGGTVDIIFRGFLPDPWAT